MSYHISKLVNDDFETALEKVTEALKAEGFGIIMQIDMQSTLKNKLNVDYRKYIILGACNPQLAYSALLAEDKIGTMLPCNVVVQEHEGGQVEVTAIDPVSSMMAVDNNALTRIAASVRDKLAYVIQHL